MFIDTHCQLQFSDFDPDRALVIGNAKKAGVKRFIVPGVDEASSRKAIELALKHAGTIFAAVGFHPYEAVKNPDTSVLEALIESVKLSGSNTDNHPEKKNQYGFPGMPGMTKRIVAIGEIGLDYHIYKGEMAAGRKDLQIRLLTDQLTLALRYDLPVILHTREAFEDMFTVLASMPRMPRGVLHCFSGGMQDIRTAMEMGLYMGIDGNVTYSKQLQTIVPHIPLSRLLLETDAPYLTPEPHRGKRNEPKYIPLIARSIASLTNYPTTDIQKQTTENTHALFFATQ